MWRDIFIDPPVEGEIVWFIKSYDKDSITINKTKYSAVNLVSYPKYWCKYGDIPEPSLVLVDITP